MHDVQLRSLLSLPVMALVLATCFFSGCKQGGPEGTLAVTGSVRSAGAPITQGTVNFVGKDNISASGTAAIGAEGKFQVNLPPGTYRVAVIAKDGVDTMDEKGTPVVAKSLVPEKYSSIETSGLEATVSDSSLTVDLDLKP